MASSSTVDFSKKRIFIAAATMLKRVSIRLNHSLVASCAGLTRASIYFAKSLLKLDGLPGQARQ